MSEEINGNGSEKKSGGKRLLFLILLLVVIVIAAVIGLGLGTNLFEGKSYDPQVFLLNIHDLPIRPADLDTGYEIISDSRLANDELVGRMTAAIGKRYVTETGRLDGWEIVLEKIKPTDIAPLNIHSQVNIFESSNGASLAMDDEWLFVYKNQEKEPDEILDKNCGIGNECISYKYIKFEVAAEAATVRYDVIFRYKNVLVWVYVNGLDYETTEQDALELAQMILDELKKSG